MTTSEKIRAVRRTGRQYVLARETNTACRRAYLIALADLHDEPGQSFASIALLIGLTRSRAQQLVEEGRRERASHRVG